MYLDIGLVWAVHFQGLVSDVGPTTAPWLHRQVRSTYLELDSAVSDAYNAFVAHNVFPSSF